MSAREKQVTITAPGADFGKTFLITKMFAYDWVKWTSRAALAVSRSGGNVPVGLIQQGMAGLIGFGIQALFACEWADAEPLMDQLFACVQYCPDANGKPVVLKLRSWDIEEQSTIHFLFGEVASFHLGFSLADLGQKFLAALTNSMLATASDQPKT
jgi:hypothetical protein